MTLEQTTDRLVERRAPTPEVVQAAAVVVLCALVGAGSGWLWFTVWDPQVGVVLDGVWYLDEQGLRGDFAATGWFVVIGAVAGVVLGLVSALSLSRSELVTLGALIVGTALATYLMWQVGVHLGPDDPRELAKTAQDGDRLPAAMEVSGRSPFLVLPGAALAALAVTYVTVPRRVRDRG